MHNSSILLFISMRPLIKVSHSRWIGSSPVSWAICYCSNGRPSALTQSWSRTCSVCWCADAAYGDFHDSSACHKHTRVSVRMKINHIWSWERGGWWWRHSLPHTHIPVCSWTRTHMCTVHTCIALTKGSRKIAVSRKPLIVSCEALVSKRLHNMWVCVCLGVCVHRDALKLLPSASPHFSIKGSEMQHRGKKAPLENKQQQGNTRAELGHCIIILFYQEEPW